MSNETEPTGVGEILSNVPGAALSALTGVPIPAPIQKNVFKAFGQLCSAAVDIPVAHMEGIAAEKRATTEARVKAISTSAEQIASQMDVSPEYAKVAVQKFSQKILREQINLDKVGEAAAEQIKQDIANNSTFTGETKEAISISEDWLSRFAEEASKKSSEEMQLLFGRILAGEIQTPSSFSIRAVKLLGELDSNVASEFRRLCSLAVSIRIRSNDPAKPTMKTFLLDARVPTLDTHPGSNGLQEYGISFDGLNILNEYGLIIAEYSSSYNYGIAILREKTRSLAPFTHQNEKWVLLPTDGKPAESRIQEFRLSGIGFSQVGKELMSIVDTEPTEKYTSALSEYFEKKGFKMGKLPEEIAARF